MENFINFLISNIYITVLVVGVIAWFAAISYKMKDLEPIRRNAEAIAKLPGIVHKISNAVSHIKGKVDSLPNSIYTEESQLSLKELEPIRKDAQRIAETPNKVEKLDKEMVVISTDVKNLSKETNKLTQKIDRMPYEIAAILGPKAIIKANSPLSLSKYGQELSDLMNASAIADRYRAELIKQAKKQDMNAYQIQQSCFEFSKNTILERLEQEDKNEYNKLANIALTEGIRIEELMPILGVLLRDQVFEAVGISLEKINREVREPTAKSYTSENKLID